MENNDKNNIRYHLGKTPPSILKNQEKKLYLEQTAQVPFQEVLDRNKDRLIEAQ